MGSYLIRRTDLRPLRKQRKHQETFNIRPSPSPFGYSSVGQQRKYLFSRTQWTPHALSLHLHLRLQSSRRSAPRFIARVVIAGIFAAGERVRPPRQRQMPIDTSACDLRSLQRNFQGSRKRRGGTTGRKKEEIEKRSVIGVAIVYRESFSFRW